MRRFFLLTLTFLFAFVAYAQEDADTTLQKYRWRSLHKEPLPDFLFQMGQEGDLGISDPGLKPAVAREQAIQRALFLHALRQPCPLKHFSEAFVKNKKQTNQRDEVNQKIESLATVECSAARYTYRVMEEYTTAYGEECVLVKVGEGEEQQTLSAFSTCMSSLNEMTYERQEQKMEVKLTSDHAQIPVALFTLKGTPRRHIGQSAWGTVCHPLKNRSYRYAAREELVTDNVPSYPLQNGLWCALMNALAQHLTQQGYTSPTIEVVTEEHRGNVQTITRESVQCNVRVMPLLRGISHNKLNMEWVIQEQPKAE